MSTVCSVSCKNHRMLLHHFDVLVVCPISKCGIKHQKKIVQLIYCVKTEVKFVKINSTSLSEILILRLHKVFMLGVKH